MGFENVDEDIKRVVEQASKSLPQTTGTVEVEGLKGQVRVLRDEWGVPHIFADNVQDLFFAQGYIHAQDRLWQMEFFRRLGSGTLSEVIGELTLEMDMFWRTIGLRRAAEREAEHILQTADEELKSAMEAYLKGVNEYIKNHMDKLPIEYSILNFEPRPWTMVDSLVWVKVMLWNLGGNWDLEILRADLIAKLGEKRAREIMRTCITEPSSLIPCTGCFLDIAPSLLGVQKRVEQQTNMGSKNMGSNNWVVDGTKSTTGKPLLANDPHLLVMMPSIWYENHLCAPDFNVTGISIVGSPAVVIGHNEHIAWGFTNNCCDVQDLYVEKINPENPHQYLFNDEWVDAEVVKEEFHVRGKEEPVVREVIITRHGPIIDTILLGIANPTPRNWTRETLALRWTGHDPSNLLVGFFKLNKAKNWQEFREALRQIAWASQNVVYADTEGNIGFQTFGNIPIRSKGTGIVPVPGWTDEYKWIGYIPFDELPSAFNPDTHYIATANQKIVGDDYPYFISHDFLPPYRVRRIVQMLNEKEKLSIEDFREMQADVKNLFAEELAPFLKRLKPENEKQGKAIEYIKNWDFYVTKESIASSIFEVWYHKLIVRILKEKLGNELFEFYFTMKTWANEFDTFSIPELLKYPSDYWFEEGTGTSAEKRNNVLLSSLQEAIEELTQTLGENMEEWQWGKIHTVTFKHQLGLFPPYDKVLNRGPYPQQGDLNTVNCSGMDPGAGYGQVTLSSYRHIIDLRNWENSLSIHSTGQSGNPASPHYDDFIEKWLNVEYHPMLFEKETIEKRVKQVLILSPKK
ncbi:MAG: penicillin acylase family protein [Candidatus Lokiarchaeia archaeon]